MSKTEKIQNFLAALDGLKEVLVADLAEEQKQETNKKETEPVKEEAQPEPVKEEVQVKSQSQAKPGVESVQPVGDELGGDFEKLKQLLFSEKWPRAVPRELICDESSEKDKTERADGILDLLIDEPLKGKAFLDFGCGEGHVTKQAALRKVASSVGYDVTTSPPFTWEEEDGGLLTTNWDAVKSKGPYDVILVYDVLDHLGSLDGMNAALTQLKDVKTPEGKIYVRCHPFCSRHGGHLYKKINKAFVHLVFTPAELKELECPLEDEFCRLMHPALTFREAFAEAGLRKTNEEIISEMAEQFFVKNKMVKNRIQKYWENSYQDGLRDGSVFPGFQTAQSFIDFVLK